MVGECNLNPTNNGPDLNNLISRDMDRVAKAIPSGSEKDKMDSWAWCRNLLEAEVVNGYRALEDNKLISGNSGNGGLDLKLCNRQKFGVSNDDIIKPGWGWWWEWWPSGSSCDDGSSGYVQGMTDGNCWSDDVPNACIVDKGNDKSDCAEMKINEKMGESDKLPSLV